MSSPLLSRFDVVLLLLDTPNKDWDHLVSTYLLQGKDLLSEGFFFLDFLVSSVKTTFCLSALLYI